MKIIIPFLILFSSFIVLNPIKVHIIGDDVYLHFNDKLTFDNNSTTIKLRVKKELDVLAANLMERPALKIAIESHTDIESKPKIAKSITNTRAENIRNYLIDRGVNPENIIAKGYGFDRPIIECLDMFNCTPEENKKNRRVEIRILNVREIGDYLLVSE